MCIKNMGVWHSFEKMKPQLCFFLKNLPSRVKLFYGNSSVMSATEMSI